MSIHIKRTDSLWNRTVSRTASYRAIKADISARIRAGHWAPGAPLPGEEELARRYEAARATINRAMRELAEEGLIERKRRAGSRVREAPRRQATFEIPLVRREIADLGAVYGYALLRSRLVVPPAAIRDRLALPASAKARHLLCLHSADARPYQLEDRWISLAATPEAAEADFSAESPNEWLVRRVPYSTAQISFSAAAADATVARALECEEGAALFRLERQTWIDARPITYVRLTFRPGHRVTARY